MVLSGKCLIWVLVFVCTAICQKSRTSRSGYHVDDLPPVYYPPTSSGSYSNKGEYEECSASYDDPDGDCILGTAGRDYPVHSKIYATGFSCRDFPSPGYYADVRTGCQVFHICSIGGRKHSTLCPNGTIFNQEVLVCDWWYNVDCSSSTYHYGVNDYVHEASKEATRNYNYRPNALEYGNNYRHESYRNVHSYGPSKTPDFRNQNYDLNNYAHVHDLASVPDYRHQSYDAHNNNNNNNNYYNGVNNNNNYAPGLGQTRTVDYVSIRSPSGDNNNYGSAYGPTKVADYGSQLQNHQGYDNAPTRPQNYDRPRDYDTPVKTVPKYIIKNVGIGEQGIPEYANTPVYKEPYVETPETPLSPVSSQQFDFIGYASTNKPSYKKKSTRSNDKSKASKATKGKQ